MKNILVLFLFLGCIHSAFGQKSKLVELFDRYQNTEGITSIKIAKPMFSLLSQFDLQDADLESIQPMLAKIDGLRILVLESPQKSPQLFKLGNELNLSIRNLDYEELITVNSKGNKIKFLASDTSGDSLDDLLLSVSSEDNIIFMLLDGKVSMQDVNNLANSSKQAFNSNRDSSQNESSNSNSDVRTREQRTVASFSGVQVSSGIKVSYTQGNEQKVIVNADGDKLQYVKTEVSGGILKIFIENPNKKGLQFKALHVEVISPRLDLVQVNSGAQFNTLNEVSGQNFDLLVESGARLAMDLDASQSVTLEANSGANGALNLSTKELILKGSSGANLSLNGQAERASYSVSSAAMVNALDLRTNTVVVKASSAANLRIHAMQSVEGEVSSGASVRYRSGQKSSSNVRVKSGGSYKSL